MYAEIIAWIVLEPKHKHALPKAAANFGLVSWIAVDFAIVELVLFNVLMAK